jgi:phospholipid/cholesterol/gamma-HCH transport system substrate-binding protein
MTDHAKNMMVGLTVIVAMVLLGWMIILFTGLPTLLTSGYRVNVRMQARSQVEVGDKINIAGKNVATVSEVSFTDPADPYSGVTLTALVDSEITLPSNTVLWVTKQAIVGRPWLEFAVEGDVPAGMAPNLSKTSVDTIVGRARVASILPDELAPALKGLAPALKSLATLSDNLNNLIAPPAASTTTKPSTNPAGPDHGPGLAATLGNLNTTLKGLSAIFGDVENQKNIKTSLKNLAMAAEKADKAMAAMKEFADETRKSFSKVSGSADKVTKRVDQLAVKLIEDAEKISVLLATVNRIALKLEKGDGTAGRLMNDPKLYNSLQEAANQTQILLKELSALVKTWKENGVKVKM